MPIDYPIWVEHRYDFKDKRVSEQFGSLVVFLQQKFHRTLNKELRRRLSRMHSWSQNNNLFIRFIFRHKFLIQICFMRLGLEKLKVNVLQVNICRFDVCCNSQAVAGLLRHTVAQLLDFQYVVEMFFGVTVLRLKDKILQVWKCVGMEVGKKYDIVFVLKSVTES